MRSRFVIQVLAWVLILISPASAETIVSVVQRCAPHVDVSTALGIISCESDGKWYSVNDNDVQSTPQFATADEAIGYARRRVADGASVDLGLSQLNSAHLREFGISVDEAFDPCRNVALGMYVLHDAWLRAVRRWGYSRTALFHAFEAYNGGPGVWDNPSPQMQARVTRYADCVWSRADAFALAYSAVRMPAPKASANDTRPQKVVVAKSTVHHVIVVYRREEK
jgi:hypothetical protein